MSKILYENQSSQMIERESNSKILYLKELEGQCKIISFTALQLSIPKTILFTILLTLSVIGLLILKYSKKFKVMCFYSQTINSSAKYFYIKSSDGHEQIQQIQEQNGRKFFYFKNLKYQCQGQEVFPVGYFVYNDFCRIIQKQNFTQGLKQQNIAYLRQIYGKNQHLVDVPSYPEYMFDTLTRPFFLFQYVICIIFVFERLYIYTAVYLIFSTITTSINYIMLYNSFQKIKEVAQKVTEVTVVRQGKNLTIRSDELVPGDIVIPKENDEMSFDGILADGQIFVNEASLTGQSIPVGKFPPKNQNQAIQQNAWVFQGGNVIQCRSQSRIIVVNTGYGTRRGRIIRKILTRVPKTPDFFKTVVIFLFQTFIVGELIFAGTVNMMIKNGIITSFIIFRFLDILAWSFPPGFPIYFNISYSFSLLRLKWKSIFGTQPEKVVEGANVKIFCFDKTGTLTKNQLEIFDIYKFSDENSYQSVKDSLQDSSPLNKLIHHLFSTCHTTRENKNSLMGDEVDVRMFAHSGSKMSIPQESHDRLIVENQKQEILRVLRINQFESKFQSMSVLVKQEKSSKHYVFLKGAPEKVQKNSINKLNFFENLVKELSLGGYRTISFGYKQIKQSQLQKYLNGPRQIFQQGIAAIGLIAFENKLKHDTKSTLQLLVESDIQPKMITGDNIFIAVQTGYRSGMLHAHQKVIVLQGSKQTQFFENKLHGVLLTKEREKLVSIKTEISLQDFLEETQYSFAVDNQFLQLKPQIKIVDSIKIFARISPQSKASIIKRLKQQQEKKQQRLSITQRFFGRGRWKIGMCGDGANDLMAIRQADVGLGISNSDASYGASFCISNISDVQVFIRESKNASQTIVDLIRYFGTISFIKIIAAVILSSDVTYFSSNEVTYFNFAHSLWMPLLYSMASAETKPTKERPNSNLMSLQNHIIYWANIIFPTVGFLGAYYFFYNSSAFSQNTNKIVTFSNGYQGVQCDTSTIIWLLLNIPLIANAFILYSSSPFKSSFVKNIPLLLLTVLTTIPAIAFFFMTEKLIKGMRTVKIENYQSGISLLIMISALISALIFTEIYKKFWKTNT